VTDGPFADKELVAGFWMIQVKSKGEAIEWAKRVPFADGEVVEIRQVFEAADFPPEVMSPRMPRASNHARGAAEEVMLMKILIALAVIVIVFVVVVALRPSEYRVARTLMISAPPPAVFAQVNDFHKWDAWNPWAKIDPAMRQTYAGAPAGPAPFYTGPATRRSARDA